MRTRRRQTDHAAMKGVAEEALVISLAVRETVREQLTAKGRLQPFAFIWSRADDGDASQSLPTVIRADPGDVSQTLLNGHLIEEVTVHARETSAAAVVLAFIGYLPTPVSSGIVCVQLETGLSRRRVWIAPITYPDCKAPIGDFQETKDHREFPQLMATHSSGWLN